MNKPFPLRFELPSPAKQLRVERVEETARTVPVPRSLTGRDDSTHTFRNYDGHWRLWLMANGDFTLGTFIQLLDNGIVNRVTWHEDGTESVMEIKDEDQR